MRNLLAFAAAAALVFAGVGWYLGWFSVHTEPGANGKENIQIELNKAKISEDLHRGESKLQGALGKKTSELTPPTPWDTPQGGTTPRKTDGKGPFNLTSLPGEVPLPPPPPLPQP